MNSLAVIKKWLVGQYKEKLGFELSESAATGANAVWLETPTDSNCASLFDIDLGIWFKFISLDLGDDATNVVDTAVQRALAESTQLSKRSGIPAPSTDSFGAWTISLLFVVPKKSQLSWESALQSLRAESGFTEELSIDCVVYSDLNDLNRELSSGRALAQLLFASRNLLQLPVQKMESWLSADDEVRSLMNRLSNEFSDLADRELVGRMVASVLGEHNVPQGPTLPKSPTSISAVRIQDMRNIGSFQIELTNNRGPVNINIVHGPNGTGKSSIFEGLSFAVAASSRRMLRFFADADIQRASSESYLRNALTPLDRDVVPTILRDGEEVLQTSLLNQKQAELNLATCDGTLLAQEDARDFVRLTGSELGGQVLRGYSVLAQSLQAHCDSEYAAANSLRQEWLRRFEINAAVTRPESRLLKLIEYFNKKSFPLGSQQIVTWLQSIADRFPERKISTDVLISQWESADGKAEREQLAKRLLDFDSVGSTEHCQRAIERWILARDASLSAISKIAGELSRPLAIFAEQRSELGEDLANWHSWAVRKATEVQAAPLPSANETVSAALNTKLTELKELGQRVSVHQQHLRQVQASILPSWTKTEPNLCPTCKADHSADGGIAQHIQSLVTHVEEHLVAARQEYSNVLAQLRSVEKQRAEVGQCPLSEERRSTISKLLSFSDGEFQSLEQHLVGGGSVEQLLRSIDTVISVPTLPTVGDAGQLATSLWRDIEAENARGSALWELPNRWGKIRETVNKECMTIVQQHLPRTLEAVWTELAMMLTPARWNLAGPPRMQAETKRGGETLRVLVSKGRRDVHVRHIFNEAENHVLGLAWFFTRYLSSGRFRHTLIALDDPAQEMDQTTFRSFTRWLQVLCRLHERRQHPLSLVLLLHQEDRALDAARATNHQMTTLRWARKIDQATTVEQLVLLSPEFSAPLPKAIVLSADNAPA